MALVGQQGKNGGMSGARVEVELLGPVRVLLDAEQATPASEPQRVLLAALALARGRPVSTAELIDALWPDEPPGNALGNLQSYLSRLRRLVGTDRITKEAAGYRLNIAEDDVDIGRVERLAEQARSCPDPAQAARLLGQAVGAWRGEPLADLLDRLPLESERARLTEWRRQLRHEWLQARLEAGEGSELLPDLEQAARADPLSERVQLLLMRARHRCGHTAEALAAADAYRRRLAAELGIDPGPGFADLYRRLLREDTEPPAAPSTPPSAPSDRFVGREPQLRELTQALTEHRIVSVVGPGGVGKTRLVLELLRARPRATPAHLVELAETSQPQGVAVAVAGALGLRAAPEGAIVAIADRLGAQPALLVLDNCEHVLDAVADLVGQLLARCPAARVLTTSRRRIGLAGERVVRLGPLPHADQVELFRERAALLRADFDTSESAAELIGEVCTLLDGLPLAVELAAKREAVFGLAQLRDRLAAGLAVLEPAGGGDRATAVTATVEWSYRLLDPDTRALLDRLAVCRGGFGLDALDHLAPPGAANPVAALAELVDASLVSCELAADPPRYRLLETVRHVCRGHLDSAELREVHLAHACWMASHAEVVYQRQRERSPEATPLLRREAANLHEALSWLAESGHLEQAARLAVLLALALSDEPDLTLVALLGRLEPDTVPVRSRTEALLALAAGVARWICGEGPAADRLLSAAADALPAEHDMRWIARFFLLNNRMFVGDVAGVRAGAEALKRDAAVPAWVVASAVCEAVLVGVYSGDIAGAQELLAANDELLTGVADVEGFVTYTRAELRAVTDPVGALELFELSYRQCDARGHTYNREVAAIGRAAVLIRLGRHHAAVAACHELVEDLLSLGMWAQLWMVLRLTGELLVALGEYEVAARLLAAADADALAPAVHEPDRERLDRLHREIGEHLDPARVRAARQEGRRGGRSGAASAAALALRRHR